MLEELHIRGLGVIDDAVLSLAPGLTVVTGETGAGKTMVVTGLLLLFGGRGDAARVRSGADQASVEGRVELDPGSPVAQRVHDAGGQLDDGTGLVLRRVVSAAGRSRAYVGGAATPVGVLGELAEQLVAVHGQSDQMRLTRPGEQRAVLDRFAGTDLAEYSAAYTRWRGAASALDERVAQAGALRREGELLAHGLAEIERAAPRPGEDVELAALAARLAHADGLRVAARTAHNALLGDADDPAAEAIDVVALLSGARRSLQQHAGADPAVEALASRVTELLALAGDLGADCAAYADLLDADPAGLEQVETRRAELGGLVRKYTDGPDPDLGAVLSWAESAQQRLADIDVSDDAIRALTAQRDAALADVQRLACWLSEKRLQAAKELAGAVSAELIGLAMPSARFTVRVVRTDPSPSGADEVEFLLQPHQDAPALPIARGASGGELSRVMLALEVCLAGSDPMPTMIFDEIDAGVGGRAAVEVGRRLATLSRAHQVVVVTHLAQVAAYADRHVVVDKQVVRKRVVGEHVVGEQVVGEQVVGERGIGDGVTASDVRTVTDIERVAELARMLAGSDSATAFEHAAELLQVATSERLTALQHGAATQPARIRRRRGGGPKRPS